MTAAVTSGLAANNTKKGEDYSVELPASYSGNAWSVFGVFDGHSGDASRFCHDSLCQRLSGAGIIDEQRLIDAFWSVDHGIGDQQISGGTTATVLTTNDSGGAAAVRCWLAWAGDSTALRMNMRTGAVVDVSVDHSIDSPNEQRALRVLEKVRKRVVELSESPLAAAALVLGRRPRADELDIYERALRRACQIKEHWQQVSPEAASAVVHSHVIRRTTPKSDSSTSTKTLRLRPLVVATALDHADPHYYDLRMTRSLGDWAGPDLVLPHPDCRSFSVSVGQWERVVIASDGLWDVVGHEEAIIRCRHCASANEAAAALLHLAEAAWKRRGKPGIGDDTTVLIVDINPSQVAFTPPTMLYEVGCSPSSPAPCTVC